MSHEPDYLWEQAAELEGWDAAQRADELRLQHDLLETLDAALHRPLTQDEAELLAWASGVRPDFNKEARQ